MQIYTVSRMDGIRCGLVSKLQQTAGMETTTPDGCAALSLHIYLYDQIYVAPKLSRSMPSLNICFSFGLRWRYGSRCGEYKNEGNNYFYCRNLSYDTVVLQFYTKHMFFSGGMGQQWYWACCISDGRTWRKTVIAISSFHFPALHSDEC